MQPKNDASDFTLILKHGKEMRVSRNEIAASSDFFSTLLNSDMRENKEGTVRLEHITDRRVGGGGFEGFERTPFEVR